MSIVWCFSVNKKLLPSIAGVLCLIIFIGAWFTPQGKVYWLQLVAFGKTGNWLVIDNSGGKTMRHWVLKNSYVGSSDQSDGWKFKSANGISYVGGDAFILRISQPLDEFLKDYKKRYNIPATQQALE